MQGTRPQAICSSNFVNLTSDFVNRTILRTIRTKSGSLVQIYRKYSNTSRPLIQVASIRGRTIGRPVQPLIVGKILNASKLPYLDHFELFEVKKLALELIFIEIPLIQV